MIYCISANKSQFRKVELRSGFNVILATRTSNSSDKDSRNGLGKSTLIDIVHFLLGKDPTERLPREMLEDWRFSMTLDLGNDKVKVSRTIKDPKEIILQGLSQELPIEFEKYKTQSGYTLKEEEWTKILGLFHFGLNTEKDKPYGPSYKSLINYFARRNGTKGGYIDPFKQTNKQQPFDVQINNAFLLGLGWEFSRNFHILKGRETVLKQIKREAISGMLSNILGAISELDSERIRLEDKANREEVGLKSYQPLEQYGNIVKESNILTEEIHSAVNTKKEYELLRLMYEKNLEEEEDVDPSLVVRMYKEAKVELPNLAIRRLEDVMEFNRMIVKNRKEFLKNEMQRLNEMVRILDSKITEKTKKRADLQSIITSHSSREEYEELIKLHQNTLGNLENIRNRMENMKKFEEGRRELNKELEILIENANLDLAERESQRKYAILKYNEYSNYLYNVEGKLNISFTKKGLELKVDIERSGSSGIDNMKIFCYDMVLSDIWSKKSMSPGFLIHDSVMFDPVDERQKAKGLHLAWQESRKNRYQYICMLNSDDVPYNEFDNDFNFNQHVVLELTDASPEGSLLGFRF